MHLLLLFFFFFFQAEDGIRDVAVTGVQTCALPILTRRLQCQTPSGEQESGVRKTCAPGTIGCRGRAFTVTARYAAPAPRFGRLALPLRFAPRPANVRIGLTH